jgi:HPt (histidine-containing phosphotransfer) domain-containing protein
VPPVLDPAGLLGASATLSPAHREVVDLFLAEAPRRLDALGGALGRGDRAESARLAHTLAGSASSLGAGRLAAACADLEALARDDLQPSQRLAVQLDAVRQALREVQTALAGA